MKGAAARWASVAKTRRRVQAGRFFFFFVEVEVEHLNAQSLCVDFARSELVYLSDFDIADGVFNHASIQRNS